MTPVNLITEVEFFNGDSTTITLDNLYNNNIFLVKVNTSNKIVNSSDTGSVQNQVIQNIPNNFQNDMNRPSFSEDAFPRIGHPAADELHETPISRNAILPRMQRSAFIPPVVGDTKNFFVETYYNSRIFTAKQATLAATGRYGNIWVMDENRINGNSKNIISNTQASIMAEKFDQIYSFATNLLGFEYGGGQGGDGGRDGDPKVQILIYDIVDNTGDVMAAGYFWGKDYYTNYAGSNQAEIFYIDASQYNDFPEYIFSALIHEFQHMVNFNMKNVKHGIASSTWYTELLSKMAEDLIAPLIGIGPTHQYHPIKDLTDAFLYSYSNVGVTDWPGTSWVLGLDSRYYYAKSFGYGAYLLRNYGGANLLQKILANNSTDKASITSALHEFSNTLNFEQTVLRFGEAIIYSGPYIPLNINNFSKTVTNTINGISYTAYGFDIFSYREPFAYTEEYSFMPYSLRIFSYEDWKNKTGTHSITLTKPKDPNVVFFVMVK
jgi:hypothetical protein